MALSISVLGPLVIGRDDCRLEKLPKKARALLAFLAAQSGQSISRERLADLLWPYQESEQARHSLRNCLLELRKALGRDTASSLVADFAHCQIQDVVTDLDEFERLSRSNEPSELQAAVDLYRGDFLADFYITSEPFQEWLAAERDRTLSIVCRVLHRLIEKQDGGGEYEAAVRSGRRLVALDPLSEIGQRALMRAYARAGRRGEALRQYKICSETLQRELSVTPDAETRALADAIARSDVSGGTHKVCGDADNRRSPLAHALEDRVPAISTVHQGQGLAPATKKLQWPCLLPSIGVAVAPVRNLTGDPDRQELVEAFTDDLVTDLLRQSRGLSLKPLPNEHARAGRDTETRDTESDYDYVVTGSAQRSSPGTMRINMRIVDAATSEYLWAGRHEFRPDELAPVQTRITRRISRELRVLLLQAASRRAFSEAAMEHGATDCLSRAASALQRGVQAELSAEAQRWYLTALANEPRNVEALTGLAITCQHLVSNPWWGDPHTVAAAADLGYAAVSIALSIAPGYVDAHCVRGMLHSAAGQLDEGASAFQQALKVDPELGVAHGFAGYNSAFLGRADETLPAIEQAMRFDKTDRRHGIWLFFGGFAELLLGRAEESIGLLRQSLERNPSYGSAQLFLTAALSMSGRRQEGADAAAKFRTQYPEYRTNDFERLWISRSGCTAYRTQIHPLFERVRDLGLAN
jgi:DNA-binding SARP family transcriptional activator/TolB-like protein/tetratricopeptide (TPR) repeat protein